MKDSLADAIKKGEKLYLSQKVDPSLIGGFIVDIGAKLAMGCLFDLGDLILASVLLSRK